MEGQNCVLFSSKKAEEARGAVGVNGGRIKSGRNDDIGGERESERGREQGIK